ncbi:Sec-independent protein translocase TatB [Micrococcus sp. HSID17228]|uniref:Sec-independent protein translocase TatB n=3 Tax=Micrococcus TaxID=1269 RepID=A0AAX0VJU6_MICLU|nr:MULTISPECIES: protein translocase TatA [Micrococcus]EZP35653.1 putative twin arginine-targeting protein translocase TatB [Micrococcus luteus]EZP53669.1 putative twin arginine-targeting protein translocase TatB [Micrococcus luteus]MBM4623173.1 Sec-independent protein translocase TatB [Micrococcus sp. JV4]MBU8763944.1 Sec-independent protein translocase TatB [Micrococcus luteus]MBY0170519.1 Sec-independent protein translocase TatB [Micrococcus luteus]
MLGINGSEFIILAVLAIVILGPEKLPEYTRAFTDWLRVMRDKAEGAKAQFKEETGTDFDEVDWRKYDPRQYDPRRIIRDALREPADGSSTPASRAAQATGISAEDVHGGLTHQDLADMDPRTLFRRPAGGGSTAAAESVAAAQTRSTAPAAGAAAVGGAAAALMASGRAEALAEERPAAVETEPDPLELLGLAPAPFDVDAT